MRYIAITIGPIYKTISIAKKTRELWGASYLFSYLMEQFLEPFRDREFIVPYVEDESLFDTNNKRSVGVFPDRAIFKAKDGDLEAFKKHIDRVLDDLAKNSPLDRDFVKNYFQINAIEVSIDEKDNIIYTIMPYLDTAELFYRVGQYDEKRLIKFLREDNRYLKNRAFDRDKIKRGFASLPEIALYELLDSTDIRDYFKHKLDEEESVYETSVYKEYIKPYHKYIAIINADGDNMGKIIKTFKEKKDYQAFAKALSNFAKESAKTVKNYGGEMIYAGGDDLLFFAPVVSNKKTIFELCEELSQGFEEELKELNQKVEQKATLSFGVSITYYKFPLYEALERSRNLLYEAKSGKDRNKIAFEVIKHSGQVFGAIVPKNEKRLYKKFLDITKYIPKKELSNFLHSLHHKLYQHKITIQHIATKDNGKERMQNFFKNYFNEGNIHTQFKELFEELSILIPLAYSYFGVPKKDDRDKALDFVYSALRFKKFLVGDK